ncbi:Aspartate carbamoyltransferase [Musa troglodytarum]|uniref:Aspartate carbamoyltransferase n=1 Tax=Musa troglodytarum TaxID=320322 RepID=A0A9E7FKF4_9LILI|nr:Aspartate carbamoyltransferase [Musa troglodytarum]
MIGFQSLRYQNKYNCAECWYVWSREIGLNMVSKDLYTVEVTEANLLSESRQFVTDILNGIFERAIEMDKIEKNSPRSNMLKGYLMATLFYEPSTSTRLSFEPAIKRRQLLQPLFFFINAGMIKDSIQHSQVFYVGKFASSLELHGKNTGNLNEL